MRLKPFESKRLEILRIELLTLFFRSLAVLKIKLLLLINKLFFEIAPDRPVFIVEVFQEVYLFGGPGLFGIL